MNVGNRIKELLKEKEMYIQDLAEKADVPPTTLYSFLNKNNATIKLEYLDRIARALNVTVSSLFDSGESSMLDDRLNELRGAIKAIEQEENDVIIKIEELRNELNETYAKQLQLAFRKQAYYNDAIFILDAIISEKRVP